MLRLSIAHLLSSSGYMSEDRHWTKDDHYRLTLVVTSRTICLLVRSRSEKNLYAFLNCSLQVSGGSLYKVCKLQAEGFASTGMSPKLPLNLLSVLRLAEHLDAKKHRKHVSFLSPVGTCKHLHKMRKSLQNIYTRTSLPQFLALPQACFESTLTQSTASGLVKGFVFSDVGSKVYRVIVRRPE